MSTVASPVTCGMCRRTFEEDRGQAACSGCPLHEGCRFVRCPHCGFENPVEPSWLASLRKWWRIDEAR